MIDFLILYLASLAYFAVISDIDFSPSLWKTENALNDTSTDALHNTISNFS
jgi:hypothetical protein